MIITSPSDTAFFIFGFPVYWYGIIIAVAVLVGVFIAQHVSKDLPKDFIVDNSPLIILCGLIGARLYYCLINAEYYRYVPLHIFNLRAGGLSIHGMLLCGILAVYFIARYYKLSFLKILDALACAVPLSQAIGRWGNFFNGEAFGFPTNGNWGLFIPVANRPEQYASYELFHPAFLYESILDLAVFFVLFFLIRRNHKDGTIFFLYLILYAIVRILIEYIRIDSALNIVGIPVAIFVSAILFIAGFAGLAYKLRN